MIIRASISLVFLLLSTSAIAQESFDHFSTGFDLQYLERAKLAVAPLAARGAPAAPTRVDPAVKTAYLDVPLLAKFTIELEYSRPYFILGPSFNFLSTAETIFGSGSRSSAISRTSSIHFSG